MPEPRDEGDSPSSFPVPPSSVPPEEPALSEAEGTREERRAKRKKNERERMPQHGKGLAQLYKQVVEKKAGKTENKH